MQGTANISVARTELLAVQPHRLRLTAVGPDGSAAEPLAINKPGAG